MRLEISKLIEAGVSAEVVEFMGELEDYNVNLSHIRAVKGKYELNYKYLLSITRHIVGPSTVNATQSIETFSRYSKLNISELNTVDYLVIKIMERLVPYNKVTEKDFVENYMKALETDSTIDYVLEQIKNVKEIIDNEK